MKRLSHLQRSGETFSPADMESELDGTRIAGPEIELERHQSKNEEPDATRAVVEDGTLMLNANELPNWVAQKETGAAVAPTKTPVWAQP